MNRLLLLLSALVITACSAANDLKKPPVPLGNFALGHNVVVAPNLVKGPVSREATKEEWIAAMEKAVQDRFGRYEGEKLYHLGISVEGYVLAQPGIPIVASPKSVLIVKVTAWDDAAQKKLNDEPREITVLESISGETIFGSGLTQSKEVQLENLSVNAAKQIQNWLVKMNRDEKWFGGESLVGGVAPNDTDKDATDDETGETDEIGAPLSAMPAAETTSDDGITPAEG